MKESIIDFVEKEKEELELSSSVFSVEETEEILLSLGFEHGEEQYSDRVLYMQFHHETYESITLKKHNLKDQYALLKE